MSMWCDRLDRRDARWIRFAQAPFDLFNRYYVRLKVEGLEHVTRDGAALYVGNHNGGIVGPDLACTLATLWGQLGRDAPLYCLAHDFAMRQLFPLGRLMQRFGAVRASANNAARIFASGGQVLVYPGGDLDAYRHFKRRHQVVFGDRTGFVRLAQRHDVPIIPVVAEGAHRSAVIFSEGKRVASFARLHRWGRLQRFPLALALPWGFAASPWIPYAPLPFSIRLRFCAPMRIDPHLDPQLAAHQVREVMQAALDEMAAAPT